MTRGRVNCRRPVRALPVSRRRLVSRPRRRTRRSALLPGRRPALRARCPRRTGRLSRQVAGSAAALDGTLERVLTATPWSEFDSAYAFRGGPAGAYLRDRFYGGSDERLSADLCTGDGTRARAQLTSTSRSSRCPSSAAGGSRRRVRRRSTTIECVMHAPHDASASRRIERR